MPALLNVENLSVHIATKRGLVGALKDVSFALAAGETLGIVGESGSGKSVLALSLVQLLRPPAGSQVHGTIRFGGEALQTMSPRQLRRVRGARISMVFQDPMTALNPYLRIEAQLMEAVLAHAQVSRQQARQRSCSLLAQMGLREVPMRMRQYPHELSGGMRQRVMIAMALINHPALVVADEPTTALDVTVAQQIMALLDVLQRERRMALILISHDLHVVARSAAHVLVMYAGRIVERLPTACLRHAAHPYTRALLSCVPSLARGKDEPLQPILGSPPDPVAPPPGCPFEPRCALATDACRQAMPPASQVGDAHEVACWHHGQVLPQ